MPPDGRAKRSGSSHTPPSTAWIPVRVDAPPRVSLPLRHDLTHAGMTTDGSPSRSVTLRLPSLRRVGIAIATVVVGLVLVIAGIRVGLAVLGPSPIARTMADGGLHEIHILGGTVYLGRIVSDDGGMLRVRDPAIVREQAAPTASSEPAGAQLVVQSLVVDPYDLAGEVLIPIDQVSLIGVVAPGSSLEVAYVQAQASLTTPGGSQPPASQPPVGGPSSSP